MNKLLQKVAKIFLGLSMAVGVGVAIGSNRKASSVDAAAGDVITSHTNIVSGKYYYIRAKVSSNPVDYFYAKGGTTTGTGKSRDNIVTSKEDATPILFTGSGTSWTMQFENGNYLYFRSNETNGYYSVSSTAQTFTASTSSNLITFTINSKKFARNSNYGTKYFGSYSSGTFVTLEECPSSSSAELTSIEIGGSMTKKSYARSESWDFSGLSVTGYYDDDNSGDITNLASFTVYDSTGTTEKSSPNAFSVGSYSIKVMATVDSFDSQKLDVSGITITNYSKSSTLEEGDYFVKYDTHYFDGTITSGHGNTTTDNPGSSGILTFSLIDNNVWTAVNSSGQYLGIGNGSTTLSWNASYNATTCALTIADGVSPGDGQSFTVKASSGRGIAWYSDGNQLRTYTTVSILTFEAATFSVTYDGNGKTSGTVPADSNAYSFGATVTVKSNDGSLAKTGYTFSGWNTNAQGTGTSYDVGATFSISGNTTLYAKWTSNKYNINYYDQGGSAFSGTHASGYPTQHTYGTATTLKSASKTGYTFAGWFTTSACTGSAVTTLGATSYTAAINLYAKWTANQYNINYFDEGGTSFSGTHASGYPTQHTYGTETTLLGATKNNYSFDGWFTNSSCTGSAVSSLGATSYTAAINLYAKWTAQGTTYTVTYNPNYGTVSPTSEEIVENDHPSFPTPTRSGYNFKGWQVGGSGTAYFDPEDYTVTGPVTFVASWTAVYTVTFNANGGSSTPASESVEDGSTFTFPSAPGTKTHYSFDGWTSTGDEPYYAAGATSPAVTGNITYTAHWIEDAKYTVTYSAASPASGSYAHNNNYGGTYTLLPFASLSGITYDSNVYRFKNYTVGGVDKNPGDTFTLSAATAVTVNFEPIPTEVTASALIATYADAHSWVNATAYSTVQIDSNITATAHGTGSNTGKYYESGEDWRFYENETATLTISAGSGYIIKSIEITFSVSNTGDLLFGGSSVTSGTALTELDTYSAVFTVGNTGSATNGQVRITNIEVIYDVDSTPVTFSVTYYGNGNTSGSAPEDNTDYTHGQSVTVLGNSGNLAKTNCSFAGWNTHADGSGTHYDEDDAFLIEEDTDLYAQWRTSVGTGTINFGSDSGRTNVNTSPVTGNDSLGNPWTVTTVGTESYNPSSSYSQIGSSNNPATYVTFSMTLLESRTVTAFSISAGGFTSTEGTITLSVDQTTVGTGHLSGTSDVTVTNSSQASGTVLTVSITNIAKGIKVSSISYTLSSEAPAPTTYTVTYNGNGGTGTMTDSNSPYNSGATVTTLQNTFVNEGYNFVEWNTDSEGNGTSYDEGETFTISGNVTLYAIWSLPPTPSSTDCNYYKVENVADITNGKYIIVAHVSSTYYAMGNSYGTKIDGSSVTVTNDVISGDMASYAVDISVTNDGYTIHNGSKYLTYSSSTNLGNSDNAYYWSITASGTHGTFACTSETTGRGLIYRAGTTNKYGGYSTGNVTSDSEYYDIELFRAFTAEDFSSHIVSNITCTAAGTSAPTYTTGYSWSALENEFDTKLTAAQQSILRQANANEQSVSIIEQAMAKYDYIVGKYNPELDEDSDYNDFIGRKPSARSQSSFLLKNIFGKNTNTVAIIVIISMVSVTAIGGYFFLRKRKENI